MNEHNELTRNDIIIEPDLEVDCDIGCIVTASVQTWFDVDKKFGTQTADDADTWINFYVKYNTESGELRAEYQIDRPNGSEWHDYTPTENEEKLLITMMEECCKKHYNCSLKDFCQDTDELDMGGMQ